MRTLIADIVNKVGEEVELCGWVATRRDHGKLIFIDFRDRTGVAQVVFLPNHTEAHALAQTIRPEWAVKITGKINARPEKMVNPDMATGTVEVEALSLEVLNESETP